MSVNYNHSQNSHSLESPRKVLPVAFRDWKPKSLLDAGCGTGTWLKAAMDFGITDVVGIDGANISKDALLFPSDFFRQIDLTKRWNLGRKFDAVLCLEVAEHLDASCAPTLIESLAAHSSTVIFSAACPGQPGQHHVNCQWPAYWQEQFNRNGFACEDSLRWNIWNDKEIEPWYRQNIFVARHDPERAEKEPRIAPVIHPDFLRAFTEVSVAEAVGRERGLIEHGSMSGSWYVKGLAAKLFQTSDA